MQISFHGAADTVTGSRHLVRMGGHSVLLDCGMFQGFKVLRERNWLPPARELVEADAVVLSHAHLDHSGWLPALETRLPRADLRVSGHTRLAEVLLLDSAHLQEEDARRANRTAIRATPRRCRCTRTATCSARWPVSSRCRRRELRLGALRIALTPVGHLLGACAVSLQAGHERLVFSGDVGRRDDLLMPAPQPLPEADVLLVESTYGNRVHPREDVAARLAQIIRDTVQRGGSVLMPSFAVGRAQALLLVLQRLKAAGEIPPDLPVYLDSPMAVQATALYHKHRRLLRLGAREADHLADGVHMVAEARQSMRLLRSRWPSVIVSASGMATGGRVLHHLKAMAPVSKHHIVFAGFQVGGSRGARLVGGASEVKIHGDYVPVRATISQLEGFSGHADADELMDWLRALRKPPRQTYVVHGEPDAADALRLRIKDQLGWAVHVPEHRETVDV